MLGVSFELSPPAKHRERFGQQEEVEVDQRGPERLLAYGIDGATDVAGPRSGGLGDGAAQRCRVLQPERPAPSAKFDDVGPQRISKSRLGSELGRNFRGRCSVSLHLLTRTAEDPVEEREILGLNVER